MRASGKGDFLIWLLKIGDDILNIMWEWMQLLPKYPHIWPSKYIIGEKYDESVDEKTIEEIYEL